MNPELRREVGDLTAVHLGQVLIEPRLSGQVPVQLLFDFLHMGYEAFRFRSFIQGFLRYGAEELEGILVSLAPQLDIKPLEQLNRLKIPYPPHVSHDFHERIELFRKIRHDLEFFYFCHTRFTSVPDSAAPHQS